MAWFRRLTSRSGRQLSPRRSPRIALCTLSLSMGNIERGTRTTQGGPYEVVEIGGYRDISPENRLDWDL